MHTTAITNPYHHLTTFPPPPPKKKFQNLCVCVCVCVWGGGGGGGRGYVLAQKPDGPTLLDSTLVRQLYELFHIILQPLKSCCVQQRICRRSSCPPTLTLSQHSATPSRSFSLTPPSTSPPMSCVPHNKYTDKYILYKHSWTHKHTVVALWKRQAPVLDTHGRMLIYIATYIIG